MSKGIREQMESCSTSHYDNFSISELTERLLKMSEQKQDNHSGEQIIWTTKEGKKRFEDLWEQMRKEELKASDTGTKQEVYKELQRLKKDNE